MLYNTAMNSYKNVPKHLACRSHKAMKPVLMHPESDGPVNHYYMIRGGTKQRNITVWEPGVVGNEYIKAFGHYHVDDLPETYWIVNGECVALLQKLKRNNAGESIPDHVADFQAIKLKAGDKLDIPARFGHLVANISETFLTTVDDSPVDFGDADPSGHPGHADYSLVERMKGFAFYVVKHDGKPALVQNHAYKTIEKTDFGGIPVVKEE